MGDWFGAAWEDIRRFADRHIRVAATAIALIAVPAALLYLSPLTLELAARPVDSDLDGIPGGPGLAAVTFLDIDGKVIGRRGPVAGHPLRLADMPAYLPAAFIAMEDRRFYDHHGVDFHRPDARRL